ncbi:LOW QUALITY PROTEIN: tRNA-splicing endonuclease subunit Sen2 [Aplochiton taeniatus]
MSEAVFQAPKRRARVYEAYGTSFPVPLSHEDAVSQDERVYRAELVNHHIVVRDPRHIHALYSKGYFGKGIFSRARPDHSISALWERTSSERARDVLLAQGLEEGAVNQTLERLCQPVELKNRQGRGEEGENGHGGTPGCGEQEEEWGEETSREAVQDSGSPQGKRPRRLASSPSSDPSLELHPEGGGEGRASPQAERPRRQGDVRFDPLAELHPLEPEQPDPEALQRTKCPRHDDWILHCGCRLGNHALELAHAQGRSRTDPEPNTTPDPEESDLGYEYVLVTTAVRRVCRVNPFRLIEYLQLSREEAFFLVYALGCLSVFHNEEPLSVSQLWRRFRCVQPHFDWSYTAYHYYRSKGWVPKPGLKYGTDLMLYRKGPPFYHASYSVVIERVDESFGNRLLGGAALRPFTWRSLAALSRITGNVSKELLLCYIIYPADLSEAELATPCCLARFKVQSVLYLEALLMRGRTKLLVNWSLERMGRPCVARTRFRNIKVKS